MFYETPPDVRCFKEYIWDSAQYRESLITQQIGESFREIVR